NDADLWRSQGGGGQAGEPAVELRGGFGVIGIEAREYVFDFAGSDNHVSELIWQSLAPMATAELKASLPDEWTLKARARAALMGDSYMEDYDWFGPDFVSYADDDWTHRSQHPNTSLDWYLDASLALGRNVWAEPNAKLNLNGGLRYTDVQWAAKGGSYVYSDMSIDNPGSNFRAYTGTLPDGPVITYRQQLPVLFAGLDADVEEGDWSYSASIQGGMTFFGLATDDHWLRDLRFEDRIRPTPVLAAAATATYSVSANLGIHVTGSIEKMFLGRADTETFDTLTGTSLGTAADVGGAELGTVSLSAGLKGSF
ncbi:MAG TPA: omptin family outer membrane protease, partial [Alphaproteobacteria bacterium]|nr:omptin family outer membrane protease [Alphaproteobacteria bacterium]